MAGWLCVVTLSMSFVQNGCVNGIAQSTVHITSKCHSVAYKLGIELIVNLMVVVMVVVVVVVVVVAAALVIVVVVVVESSYLSSSSSSSSRRSIIILPSTDKQWITVVLALIGKCGIAGAFSMMWLYSSELFPTVMRNSATGAASVCARVGGIVAPYIANLVSCGPWTETLLLVNDGVFNVAAFFFVFFC